MINGVNHITLAIKDIERSFTFYHDVLQLKPLCQWDQGAYFLAGDLWFCLNVDEKRMPNPCYTHYAFSVKVEEFESMSQRILNSGAPIFKENTSFGKSLYFFDPDHHKLEIHVSDWKERIDAKKSDLGPWRKVKWFI